MQFLEYLGRPEEREDLFNHWTVNVIPAVERFQCGSLYKDTLPTPVHVQDPIATFTTIVDTFVEENKDKVC